MIIDEIIQNIVPDLLKKKDNWAPMPDSVDQVQAPLLAADPYKSEEDRDKILAAHIDKIHKDHPRISVDDDNGIEVDRLMWAFYRGDHYWEPDSGATSTGVKMKRMSDKEAENFRAKLNQCAPMAKIFSAKMMEMDAEPATLAYPDNRDYIDETMSLYLNCLSRVNWREKSMVWEGMQSAKDGCVTGKGHMGVISYKKENGEGDFDVIYMMSLEVFADVHARKYADRRFVYRKFDMDKSDIEKLFHVKVDNPGNNDGESFYDYGSNTVTVWDFYGRRGGKVLEDFHCIALGASPRKVVHYERYKAPCFPIYSCGFNVPGEKALYGRGFFRDIVGAQLAMNEAHSVVQNNIHNYEVATMADRQANVEFENIAGHEVMYYSDGKKPEQFRPPDIPQWIYNYPQLLKAAIMDATGIRDFSQIPDQGNRMAVGTMNVLVQSEKRAFTEEMVQFSKMLAAVMKHVFYYCQLYYSREKLIDMVGQEHIPAIDKFKEIDPKTGEYVWDVWGNYDFNITIGTGFSDNITLAPQDLSMLVKTGIISPKEAKAYLQRQGILRSTPFGALQSESKAKLYLDIMTNATQPTDVVLTTLTIYDDLDVMISVMEDFVRSNRYVHMITADPHGMGLEKANWIKTFLDECYRLKLERHAFDVKLQLQAQMIERGAAMMAAAPGQGSGRPPAQPGQGQEPGNPEQMPQ